jgi:hypothetical protein
LIKTTEDEGCTSNEAAACGHGGASHPTCES